MPAKKLILVTLLLIPSVSSAQTAPRAPFACPTAGFSGSADAADTSAAPAYAVTRAINQAGKGARKICRDKVKGSTFVITNCSVTVGTATAATVTQPKASYPTTGRIDFCCLPPVPRATKTPTPTITPTKTPTPTVTPTPLPRL